MKVTRLANGNIRYEPDESGIRQTRQASKQAVKGKSRGSMAVDPQFLKVFGEHVEVLAVSLKRENELLKAKRKSIPPRASISQKEWDQMLAHPEYGNTPEEWEAYLRRCYGY